MHINDDTASKWKLEFPVLAKKIHAANCSQGPQATKVRAGIEKYLESWLENCMEWDLWMEETVKAKREFAKLINASPNEIAVSTSASAAAASIASSLNPSSGRKKIITTEAEFPTVAHVWLGHQKYGYEVQFIPLKNGRIIIDDYENFADNQTILVSATHVYYQNGFKQDLKKIADIVHQKGSFILVDAYQSLGTCNIDVKEMDIDILISGNLKYLLGIPGIAFIYVKQSLVEELQPAVTGWFGQENPFLFDSRNLNYAADGRKFDTGTPPVINAYAARAGMEMINEVNPKYIEERINYLSEYTIQKAEELKLLYVGPENILEKGATTAIKVDNPHQVEALLKERNIIASARGDVIRIAPHFFTTTNDIETVLYELRNIVYNLISQ